MMDIKAMVSGVVEKIQKDPSLLAKFQDDPVSVIETLVGIDLPNDQLNQVAELVKAKLDLDKAGDLLKGLGGLFH